MKVLFSVPTAQVPISTWKGELFYSSPSCLSPVHASRSFQIISHSRARISLPATEISLFLDKTQHLFNSTEQHCHCKRWHVWSWFHILSIREAFLIIILRWILAVNPKAGGHVLPLSAHSRFMVLLYPVPGLPTSSTGREMCGHDHKCGYIAFHYKRSFKLQESSC